MKDILEEILAYKRKEVEREKAELPPEQLFALVEGRWRNAHDGTARHGKVPAYMTDARKHRSMRESLAASRSGIIAEFKRKSPSKGGLKKKDGGRHSGRLCRSRSRSPLHTDRWKVFRRLFGLHTASTSDDGHPHPAQRVHH